MRILAVSGSIRNGSSNSALLKAIRNLLPSNSEWIEFKISELPFFDPQIQFGLEVPKLVQTFRQFVFSSDYLVISTPEYAHGIPGILKNALEWLICEESIKKKVILLVTSPSGGDYVKEYLLETLRTMDMLVGEEMTFVIRTARKDISTVGDITDLSLKMSIVKFLKSVGIVLKNEY